MMVWASFRENPIVCLKQLRCVLLKMLVLASFRENPTVCMKELGSVLSKLIFLASFHENPMVCFNELTCSFAEINIENTDNLHEGVGHSDRIGNYARKGDLPPPPPCTSSA